MLFSYSRIPSSPSPATQLSRPVVASARTPTAMLAELDQRRAGRFSTCLRTEAQVTTPVGALDTAVMGLPAALGQQEGLLMTMRSLPPNLAAAGAPAATRTRRI